MATVIFDFDSTLISCESLELILKEKLHDPHLRNQIHAITEKGMSGECSFQESLAERLKIASPTLQDIKLFSHQIRDYLTEGVEHLIKDLQHAAIPTWIVSGGLYEAIIPAAEILNIPKRQVGGVKLQWDDLGHFLGIDNNDPFSISKVEGAKNLVLNWQAPIIAVGDGMTDYALFEKGLVDHFIAFTEHVRRPILLQKGVIEAANVQELRQQLGRLLNASSILS